MTRLFRILALAIAIVLLATAAAPAHKLGRTKAVASRIPEAVLEQVCNGQQVERMGNPDPHMSPHNVYSCQGHDQWVAIALAYVGIQGFTDAAVKWKHGGHP